MQEKRHFKRWHLIYYLQVRDRHTSQAIGHLIDINQEGMMLLSEVPISCDRIFHLQMLLPEEVVGMTSWEFDAKSLWSKPDVNPNLHTTGFHLLNVLPEDVGMIECLIDDYGFRD